MKKVILSAVAILMALSVSAQQIRYVDAAELNIIGKAIPTSKPFTRIDTSVYHFPTPKIERYATYSTGLAVLFTTDSKEIHARWETSPANAGANMTAITQKGLDLYIKGDGKWIFAGVGSPNMRKAPFDKHEYAIVKDMEPGVKECMLYLPIYSEEHSIKIGVQEGASVESIESPFRHRIAIYGSSYTQGISTTRAGMSYPMQLMRMTGLQFLSLGCSGNCKMQPYFADVLCDVEADAFVFDCFSNPDARLIEERLFPFIERLQAAHPGKPLIFQQTIYREGRNFSHSVDEKEKAKQKMAAQLMRIACRKYDDVYFIQTDATDSMHSTSVDGIHPSDYGYTLWAKSIKKPLLKILAKYGIR